MLTFTIRDTPSVNRKLNIKPSSGKSESLEFSKQITFPQTKTWKLHNPDEILILSAEVVTLKNWVEEKFPNAFINGNQCVEVAENAVGVCSAHQNVGLGSDAFRRQAKILLLIQLQQELGNRQLFKPEMVLQKNQINTFFGSIVKKILEGETDDLTKETFPQGHPLLKMMAKAGFEVMGSNWSQALRTFCGFQDFFPELKESYFEKVETPMTVRTRHFLSSEKICRIVNQLHDTLFGQLSQALVSLPVFHHLLSVFVSVYGSLSIFTEYEGTTLDVKEEAVLNEELKHLQENLNDYALFKEIISNNFQDCQHYIQILDSFLYSKAFPLQFNLPSNNESLEIQKPKMEQVKEKSIIPSVGTEKETISIPKGEQIVDDQTEEGGKNLFSVPVATQIILRPFTYTKTNPGKGLRRVAAEFLNHWFKLEEDKLEETVLILMDLHHASLIVDDIEDGSTLRRGQEAAHIKFGIPQALNSANFVYFQVLHNLMDDGIQTVKQFVSSMMLLHIGQGIELYWRDENIKGQGRLEDIHIPTETDYSDLIVKKTSLQFTLMRDMLKSRSSKQLDLDLTKLCGLLGLHFQIRDDLMNLVSDTYESNKGFCEDIAEGKFSFPIIIALNKRNEENGIGETKAARLLQIMSMQINDRDLKMEALQIIKDSGALKLCISKLERLTEEIYEEVRVLGGNPLLEKYMALATFTFSTNGAL